MRISDSQPPVSDTNPNNDDSSSTKPKDDKASPFSQLLSKKRGNNQDADNGKGMPGQGTFDPFAAGLIQNQLPKQEMPVQAGQVESKTPVSLPVELQQLVKEISVVTGPAGAQQVHIELNSQVLKGLHIQIERREGQIAIQFQSTSSAVTDLLQKNVASLSQALSDKGMSEPAIRISGPGESANPEFKGYSRGRSGGQPGGGQRGGAR